MRRFRSERSRSHSTRDLCPGGAASTLVRLGADRPILIRQGPLDVLELNEVMRLPLSVPPRRRRGRGGGEGN